MSSFRLVTTISAANPNLHDLYLDDSGQIAWIGGDIEDTESYARMVAQRILCRSLFLRTEWYQDQREGTPWDEIWAKGITSARLKEIFRRVIITTPGVRTLNSIEIEFNKASREAEMTWEVATETGQIVSSADLDEPFVIEVPNG